MRTNETIASLNGATNSVAGIHPLFALSLFSLDGKPVASASASFDMMLAWIAQCLPTEIGEQVVSELVDHFGVERQRTSKEHQRVPAAHRTGARGAQCG